MQTHHRYAGIFVFLFLAALINANDYRCINPNNHKGYCVNIFECPSLTEVIQKPTRSVDDILFLQYSQCENGYGEKPHVCCTPDKEFTNTDETTTETTITERPEPSPSPTPTSQPVTPDPVTPTPVTPKPTVPVIPPSPTVPPSPSNGEGHVLPQPPKCGQNILGDKIYNGNDTAIDEYPWMVLLEYIDHGKPKAFKCGGSLINQRYVLTAAHCVRGAVLKEVGPLYAIRLGEYDISSDIDCIEDDCNDEVLTVGIEATIPHPLYHPNDKNRHYDIALIRLATDVDYTFFIKPICLPLERTELRVGEQLTVAGWGRTLSGSQSNVKKQLNVPINDFHGCAAKFREARHIKLMLSQFCAGGEFGKDSCDGDSGGPLMRQGIYMKWFQEGIVSFGNRCGLEGWPGVYTRVVDHMEWIQKTLRP